MGCVFSHDGSKSGVHSAPQKQDAGAWPPEIPRNQSTLPREDVATRSPKYRKGHVKSYYKFGNIIAKGGFAQVVEVKHKKTGARYACKIMNFPSHKTVQKEEMSREDIFREIDISASLEHKNIVCLAEFYFDKKKVYMIFEKMEGGRLLEVVLQRPPENSTRKIFRQLIEGIAYLHSMNITHRDLKLENILLEKANDLESIKIADFGLAKQSSRPLQTMCGTLYYVAPEVINDNQLKFYGKAVDMWSAGVLLYILLSGSQPFAGKNDEQIFDKILGGNFGLNKPQWRRVSSAAKDLVCKLLEIDSAKRLTAQEVLEHSFMKQE